MTTKRRAGHDKRRACHDKTAKKDAAKWHNRLWECQMPLTTTKWIWMNGRLVPWADAKIHVMTYALHMGSSVFEGIRFYAGTTGTVIFRPHDHLRRFEHSGRMYRMDMPYTADELLSACKLLVRENALASGYLRPLAWLGVGSLGTDPTDKPVELMVATVPWDTYLGGDALTRGVDVGISSWRRFAPGALPTMAKAGGAYLSSQLIASEAKRHGYGEGLALDASGFVSEGSAENLFLVRDETLYTPPITSAILPGITRDTVLTLASDMGLKVREERLPREALYVADELFLTGTAAEVTPVRAVDGIAVGEGERGPITSAIQQAFFGLFSGETADKWGWLEKV